jgi:6-phosphogluconolactonase (cycloisomerase 2 family)
VRLSIRAIGIGVALSSSLNACADRSTGPAAGSRSGAASQVLYVLSNNPGAHQNSVLGYTRNADGTLSLMADSPFLTGGTGVANPKQIVGPDDVDFPIAVSADHRFLFAVNPGSNTIAVMAIAPNGSLAPVPGSPFSSGGIDPVSIGVDRNKLFVVNKAEDPAQPAAQLPNYTGFAIGATGILTPLAGSTVTTIAGASPQLALVVPSKALLFGADFMAPATPSHRGALRAFAISASGALIAAPGTPMDIPGDSGQRVVLGLAIHPTQPVLYAGFVAQNRLGVYSYDGNSGALIFRTTAINSGRAICWITTNVTGSALYTSNTTDNSVSWYNATNALAPTESQHLVLKEPGPLYVDPTGTKVPTSQAYQLTLDPVGTTLYVISQHTNPDFSVTSGNLLHVLSVATNGSLSEPGTPVRLPVATRTRPWGVIAF